MFIIAAAFVWCGDYKKAEGHSAPDTQFSDCDIHLLRSGIGDWHELAKVKMSRNKANVWNMTRLSEWLSRA